MDNIASIKSCIKVAVLPIVILLSGCAATGNNNESENFLPIQNSRMDDADSLLEAGQFKAAQAEYISIANSLDLESSGYYTQGLYRQKAAAKFRAAFTTLQSANPETAGNQYRSAIELYRKDLLAHRDILIVQRQRRARRAEITNSILLDVVNLGTDAVDDNIDNDVFSDLDLFQYAEDAIEDVVENPAPPVERVAVSSEGVAANAVGGLVSIPLVPDVSYLSSIGRVLAGTSGCTGSLVKPSLVLTNAHCIFDGGVDYNLGPTSLKEGKFTFRREWLYGAETYDVKSYYTHRGKDSDWDGQIKNDWVLLEIVNKPGAEVPAQTLPVVPELADKAMIQQLSSSPSQLDISIPGYSVRNSTNTYMTMDVGCSINLRDYVQSVVSHDCNTSVGASGAPIVAKDETGKVRIVALNVGRIVPNEDVKERNGLAITPAQWLPTLQTF